MANYQGFHPCIMGPRHELFGRPDCVRVSSEQPQDLGQTAEAVLNLCPLDYSRAL